MPDFAAPAANLLQQAGVADSLQSIHPLVGGRNNRVYCLHTCSGRYLLKQYFRHANDTRDRQRAELEFLQFCQRQGIDRVPHILAHDRPLGLTLMDWVDGRRIAPKELAGNSLAIGEAVAFFRQLVEAGQRENPSGLALAADACPSLGQHIQQVRNRLEQMQASLAAQTGDELSAQALRFVETELAPRLKAAVDAVTSAALPSRYVDHATPVRDMLPSPSDFGFHNALFTTNGFVFLDFEYAGMDDPAKLLCDTLCQADMPIGMEHLPKLAQALCPTERSGEVQDMIASAELLLPLHRLKWCCILLNEFKKTDGDRRHFAAQGRGFADMRQRQLQKSMDYLEQYGG